MVCAHAMGFGAALGLKTLLGVIVSDMIFFLLLFAMSALATIVCGNTIIALLLQLWVFFAPVTVQMLREGLLSLFCKTYSGDMSTVFNNLRLSPAVQYFTVSGTKYSSGMADDFQLAGQSALGLLLVYAAVALMILFGGMRSRETSIPAVEHLRQPLLPERSLLPLNTSEDDTQER